MFIELQNNFLVAGSITGIVALSGSRCQIDSSRLASAEEPHHLPRRRVAQQLISPARSTPPAHPIGSNVPHSPSLSADRADNNRPHTH